MDLGTEPARHGAPAPSRSLSRLAELEARLARAQEARAAQAAAVEGELERLSSIYRRMRDDLQRVREERDLALREARLAPERRAAEADRLAAAGGGGPLDEFVRNRLPPEPTELRELHPGELPEIPGFRMIGLLGRGGMATVFRAERLADGRQVAVKLLTTDKGHAGSRTEMFLREAALMLQVDHPGILRALDAGECAYGQYLVLPVIEGHSLAGRVRRKGPLDEKEAVRVAIEVGRALRYCARGGLTHRDVKPSNLLEGPDGRIRLCDFGLAALRRGDAGRPYGSPGFASPEQIVTPDDVDERADIYGLATTLWTLVVGRRPFEGDARSSFEAARRQDLADPRIEGADISPRLARVIRRMGRADRSRRYRNWDECLLDLMLIEKGNPPLAAQLSEALGTDRGEADLFDTTGSGGSVAQSCAQHGEADEDAPSWDVVQRSPRPPREEPPASRQPAAAARAVPRPSLLVVAAGLLGTLVLLSLILIGGSRSHVGTLEDRARALAAEGHPEQAVEALRRAADLLAPDEAARLRAVADEIDLGLR